MGRFETDNVPSLAAAAAAPEQVHDAVTPGNAIVPAGIHAQKPVARTPSFEC